MIRLRLTPSGRLRYARCPAALRTWSNEGFESKPPYPPNEKGTEGLLCMGAGWWEGLIRLRLTPSGRLRYAAASCGA
ncbi:MAG: hypothetical protein AB2695_02760, partial [Candidatus Thiodiazotropha endolucinida]